MDHAEARRLLSIDATASEADLKRAYRSAIKRWHPDRATSDSYLCDSAHEQAQRINTAYRLLLDHGGKDFVSTGTPPAWRGRPIRTVRPDWWPAHVIASDRTPVRVGVVIFIVVWAVLAGLAVSFEAFLLR